MWAERGPGARGGTSGVMNDFCNQTRQGLPASGSVLSAADPHTLK